MKEVRLQRKKTYQFDDGTQVEKAGDLGNKRNTMSRRLKAGVNTILLLVLKRSDK